jgi:squalene-hopene/tetraprenyl-beta-curcumene cyclase
VHPYTNADPGGWAWTDLSGGVPDADDTPGAILALLNLEGPGAERCCGLLDASRVAMSQDEQNDLKSSPEQRRVAVAIERAVDWLLDLQNTDGGWPTFCRGWGTLPFDRSAPDLTAHAIRALQRWHEFQSAQPLGGNGTCLSSIKGRGIRIRRAIKNGFHYLARSQRPDGSWLPLWFGNQHGPNDENPTYGTARVLPAYRESGQEMSAVCRKGVQWLIQSQNTDGGWGGIRGGPSSIEETALATEVLNSLQISDQAGYISASNGVRWLIRRYESYGLAEPSPIGFYFAKLWYFEKLYPVIFATGALRSAVERLARPKTPEVTRIPPVGNG